MVNLINWHMLIDYIKLSEIMMIAWIEGFLKI